MGNTVGRLPSKNGPINLSYIAGFLDGDGSIMLQIHKRGDNGKFRIKTTICFYQDKSHKKEIDWIRKVLNCGYTNLRNDGIYELRIEGFARVFEILTDLKPYIKFKKKQVKLMLELIPKLRDANEQIEIAGYINKMHTFNYYSSQRT